MENDRTALNELVDLDALKEQHKTSLEKRVDHTFGGDPKRVPEFLRQGARWIDDATANAVVDVDWVREQLRWRRPTPPDAYPSIITDTTFAFFEAPTRFLIRVGDLGEQPVHVRMALQDWHWRVTEIYN